MKLPKMIVSDLDGTLLPQSKALTPRSRDVLGRLAAKGVKIALASGKFQHLTQTYATELGPETAVVALNGARTSFGEGHDEVESIPRDLVEGLLHHHDGPGWASFADNGGDEMVLRFPGEEIPGLITVWASQIHRVDDVRGHLVGDPGLLVFFGPDREEMANIARECDRNSPAITAELGHFPQNGAQVVIQRKGISKGSGVLGLCEHFGIAPDECMVFGDWINDVPMFQVGCVNVAMANAEPPLKELAQHVTEQDNEHEGVAHFLETAFL